MASWASLSQRKPSADSHFLARVRGLLTARGHVTMLVDTPSDRRDLDGDFRDSREHAADLASVIAYARKAFGKPVWLVGHSRGTHSAVTAAIRLQGDNAPDGVVLAAPMLDSNRFASSTAKPLQEAGVETLQIPVLVLQHTKDACPVAAPGKLPELQAKLPPATSKVITIRRWDFQGSALRRTGVSQLQRHRRTGRRRPY